ncbi:hypothetical protein Tco_0183755 [Tanacetum coccineum]
MEEERPRLLGIFSDFERLKTKKETAKSSASAANSQISLGYNFGSGLKRDGSPMTSASSKKLKTGDVEVDVEAPSHRCSTGKAQVKVPSQEATVEDVEVPSNIASKATTNYLLTQEGVPIRKLTRQKRPGVIATRLGSINVHLQTRTTLARTIQALGNPSLGPLEQTNDDLWPRDDVLSDKKRLGSWSSSLDLEN